MAINKTVIATGLLRCLLLMGALTGFCRQSWQVAIDYFQYLTKTSVKYREPSNQVIPPMMVFCVRFHSIDLWHEIELKNIFTGKDNVLMDSDNSWTVRSNKIPKGELKYIHRKFLKSSKYCMYTRISNEFTRREMLSPRMESPFAGLPYFYEIGFGPEPLFANSTYKSTEQGCRARTAYFQVVVDEADLLDSGNPFVVANLCTEKVDMYKVDLSYAESTMKKLEPPYDTKCRDYNRTTIGTATHILNSHACYSECLNRRTAKWKVLPDQNIIDREKYADSNLALAHIKIIADENKLNRTMSKTEEARQRQLISTYMQIHPSWKGIVDSCTYECEQPDCFTQKITPLLFYIEGVDENPNLRLVKVLMRLTHDPIIDVIYEPKHHFVDFLVYMTGSLNFWLGIAAIQAADVLGCMVKRCAGKKYQENDEARPQRLFRRTSIIDQVRRLSVVLPKPENRRLPPPPRGLVVHTPLNVQSYHKLAQTRMPTYSEYLAFIIRNGFYEPRRVERPTEPFLPNRPLNPSTFSLRYLSPPRYIPPDSVDNRL